MHESCIRADVSTRPVSYVCAIMVTNQSVTKYVTSLSGIQGTSKKTPILGAVQ